MKFVNNSYGSMVNCKSVAYKFSPYDAMSKIVLVAQRDIGKGEELFFDYGFTAEKRMNIAWLRGFCQKFCFDFAENMLEVMTP